MAACADVLGLEDTKPAPVTCERDSVCPPSYVCDADTAHCVPACQPDARQCDGVRERVCDATGHFQSRTCSDGCGAGSCQPVKSCDLKPKCGVDQASCCEVREVSSGAFELPNDPRTGQLGTVERAVSRFGLDRFEVTIGRFRRFILNYDDSGIPTAGQGAHPDIPGSGWQADWTTDIGTVPTSGMSLEKVLNNCEQVTDGTIPDDAAVGCISWYLANAFCIWDGGRLPSEAEWSFAAMGGEEQRIYPWSKNDMDVRVDDSLAVYHADQSAPASTAPERVGQKPDGQSKFGNDDMAGNVWEWVADGFRSPFRKGPCRSDRAGASAQRDCEELEQTDTRVQKGGSYKSDASSLRNSTRLDAKPGTRERAFGFRCARDLETEPEG